MCNQRPSFRFEIDNFSKKETTIETSEIFSSGGFEWYLFVCPERKHQKDHLSLYLYVANYESLPTGWRRTAKFYFVLYNQSDKELYRSPMANGVLCAKTPGWGFTKLLPLSNFQEKGFLENDRLIVEVYISNVEDVSEEKKKKETVNINGFQVFVSQFTPVWKLFKEHPDIAKDFKPKNQVVKTEYMNVLLGLINTLNKPPRSLTEIELSNAQSELSELTEEGFKLEWLETKLEEVSLEMKKAKDADESRVQKLEERVKNIELMDLGSLKSKLEEDSLEKKKTVDVDVARVQRLEESVKNLEMMVLDLKVELDKEKAKSSVDGFLLVDEAA